MTTTLQTAAAAAQPAVDPNTMVAATPVEQQAQAAPTIASEHEQFVDEWAKAPNDAPPVRTWTDPSLRTPEQGEFLAAWKDEPQAKDPFAPATPDQNAAAITDLTKTQQAATAKPAEAAAQPVVNDPWNNANTMYGAGSNGILV